jgi:hypothetical protein
MKLYNLIFALVGLLLCTATSAQTYVDLESCKIKIPKGYQVLLKPNSSELMVFEKLSDLSTVTIMVLKDYNVDTPKKKIQTVAENKIQKIVAKSKKYTVMTTEKATPTITIRYTDIYFDGVRVAINGSDIDNWQEIVASCK